MGRLGPEAAFPYPLPAGMQYILTPPLLGPTHSRVWGKSAELRARLQDPAMLRAIPERELRRIVHLFPHPGPKLVPTQVVLGQTPC